MIHALGPNEVNKHWKEFYPEKCRPHLTKEDWIDFMQILEKINKDEKFSNWESEGEMANELLRLRQKI